MRQPRPDATSLQAYTRIGVNSQRDQSDVVQMRLSTRISLRSMDHGHRPSSLLSCDVHTERVVRLKGHWYIG